MEEVCKGCGHPLSRHFRSVDGTVRCLSVNHQPKGGLVSNYTWPCDCVDFESAEAKAHKDDQTDQF